LTLQHGRQALEELIILLRFHEASSKLVLR